MPFKGVGAESVNVNPSLSHIIYHKHTLIPMVLKICTDGTQNEKAAAFP